MYQKEAYGASNLDTLLNLDDVWCNTSAYFDPADSMAFTPTTLAKFESTFSDLNAELAAAASEQNSFVLGGALNNEAAANQLWGSIATSQASEYSDSEDDSDGSNSDWSSASKKRKTTKRGEGTVTRRGGEETPKPPRKLPGPRPSRPLDQMTPLELERRQRRRLRNKNAATKCRQRRLEVTNELLQETDKLEKESSQLEREIESLLRQKDQLQFVLEAHLATCRGIPFHHIPESSAVQNIPEYFAVRNIPESSAVGQTQPVRRDASFVAPVRPSSLHIPTTCGASAMPAINSSLFSFDVTTSLTGLTPMLSTGELSTPGSFLLLSPSMLLA